MVLRILMLGDIVGKPGRQVVQQQLDDLKREYGPDVVVANAENAAGGSGLTPQIFQKLQAYGVHGVTLGDHVYRQRDILPTLEREENIVRPANLPAAAVGNRWMILQPDPAKPPLAVLTLLGRLFMTGQQADDPFAAADEILEKLPRDAVVLVEMHAEATSEKVALGHHLDGRVAAVVGTHTHIPTADAKILPGGTGYITDLGMTGPYDSVLGRRKDRVLQFMTTAMPAPFDVATDDVRLCGVLLDYNVDARRVTHIERIERKAELDRPPFGE
ncbi:MAG: TIGR00282 family metallophosphoesterase [Phycisphaeraceae bacterium]